MTITQTAEAIIRSIMCPGEVMTYQVDPNLDRVVFSIRCLTQIAAMERTWRGADALAAAGFTVPSTGISFRGIVGTSGVCEPNARAPYATIEVAIRLPDPEVTA